MESSLTLVSCLDCYLIVSLLEALISRLCAATHSTYSLKSVTVKNRLSVLREGLSTEPEQ